MPLLGERRLLIVRDVDRLSGKEQKKLIDYLKQPNPETIMVMVARFPKPGEAKDNKFLKRIEATPLFKLVDSEGDVLRFSMSGRGKQKKLEAWINEQFRQRGRKVEDSGIQLLMEKVGQDLRFLSDAIEKVCLFSPGDGPVNEEEIETVVSPLAERGIFEFVDAVADRRRDIALSLLNRLARQGESPQRMFALLLRQFRMIARTKALSRDHEYKEIASILGVPPFVVGKLLKQSKKYSSKRLRSVFSQFQRAQVELHSTKYLEEKEYANSILEMLVVQIIG